MDKDIIKKLKVSLYYISGANIFTAIAMILLYFQTKEIYLLIASFVMIGVGVAFFLGSDKVIQMILSDSKDRENQSKK